MTAAEVVPGMTDEPGDGARLADVVWARWPAWLWSRSPTAGLMAADGGWLRAFPGAGAGVPLVAALAGLWWGAIRPANQVTYSSSTALMLAMMGVALLGCGVAVWLWLGFVVGDLVFFAHPALVSASERPRPWDLVVRFLVPQLLSYLLLAVLLLAVPLTALVARGTVRGLLRPRSPVAAVVAAPVAAALGAGIQAAAWSQSFPLLIRPLWIWRDKSPVADAIVPVQEHRWWFGLVAAAVAGLVALIAPPAQRRVQGRRPLVVVAAGSGRRAANTAGRGKAVAGSLARAAATTLLLAGLIETWVRAGVVFGVLLVAFVFQARFAALTPVGRWWLARVPLGLRLLIAVVVAGAAAWLVGRRTVESSLGFSRIVADDFGPMLAASVLAIVVVALLLPRPHDGEDVQP